MNPLKSINERERKFLNDEAEMAVFRHIEDTLDWAHLGIRAPILLVKNDEVCIKAMVSNWAKRHHLLFETHAQKPDFNLSAHVDIGCFDGRCVTVIAVVRTDANTSVLLYYRGGSNANKLVIHTGGNPDFLF